ncbi:MAG: class I SAM-dependent rRNA methyltransferase, partial [Planctomycetes bacterium]|nr:class I SAM-dependent rRNA methyltransferase [Planctomycetota bacterium]
RHPAPHPFVRRGLVRSAPRLPNSAVVTLRTPEGVVLGDGFWNATSDIAVRRLTDGDVRFDSAALDAALDRALHLRRAVPGLLEQDALRVVHAEGDELSGLVVDRYGEVLVLELHSAGWVPLAADVAARLHARLGTTHHRIVLSERTARLEGCAPLDLASPSAPRALKLREHGVRWQVDFTTGHKTGFFCDQRENRARFAQWAAGDVLDVCACTGGFAVTTAVLGRPESVTGVELDEEALSLAERNANLNQVRVSWARADAFDWLRQVAAAGRRFHSVVVDPPKFIPTRADVETGRGKYHDLNRLALRVLHPGGLLLTCSCSGLLSREDLLELVATAARKEGRSARLLASTGAGPDHPVLLNCPETEYLKALWMRVA